MGPPFSSTAIVPPPIPLPGGSPCPSSPVRAGSPRAPALTREKARVVARSRPAAAHPGASGRFGELADGLPEFSANAVARWKPRSDRVPAAPPRRDTAAAAATRASLRSGLSHEPHRRRAAHLERAARCPGAGGDRRPGGLRGSVVGRANGRPGRPRVWVGSSPATAGRSAVVGRGSGIDDRGWLCAAVRDGARLGRACRPMAGAMPSTCFSRGSAAGDVCW